ncbi:MAG: tetratricopeptide repeat protein [Acidobacteriaceae bacterium]
MMNTRARLGWVLAVACALPIVAPAQSANQQSARYASAGQQAMMKGDYATAQRDFDALAKLNPDIAEVHATLAAICFKRREYDRAVQEIHIAQRLKPGLPRLDSLLGSALAEEGHFADALPHLEKGFHQSGDSAVKRMCGLELIRAYSDLGRDSDAVEISLKMNKLYPNDPEVLYHTGRVYGNFAYETMEKLHDTAPGSIWMLQAQGEANESQKAWEPAITAFNHVLALDPKRPGIHYRLGRVYLGRYRQTQNAVDKTASMREFQAELAIDPGNANATYELGNIQAESGNLDDAAKQFAVVLKHYPDFEEALVGLAGVDLSLQNAGAARPLLERATRLRPNDEVAWWRLSQADRATGNNAGQQKALATFQKLRNAAPSAPPKPNAADAVTPQQLEQTNP